MASLHGYNILIVVTVTQSCHKLQCTVSGLHTAKMLVSWWPLDDTVQSYVRRTTGSYTRYMVSERTQIVQLSHSCTFISLL